MIIAHRINTIEELRSIPANQGIEFDVRDSNGKCIVTHDAFQEGLDLEVFLQEAGNRFFIVNIKSEGIEDSILQLMKRLNYDNFFLLDCSFPKIIQLKHRKERRIAVRLSEYESIETVLNLANDVEWVWVDCFTNFPLTKEMYQRIRQAGMKICLVSPDLQKQPEKIQEYIDLCLSTGIYADAVCCKYANRSAWENYYTLQKKEYGLLLYHQGWTDIVNTSALINYFARRYNTLYMIVRDDSFDLFDFISRHCGNIVLIGAPFGKWHEYVTASIHAIRHGMNNVRIEEDDMHIIGLDDVNRVGKYKLAFKNYNAPLINNREADDYVFWKKFYSAYDIPFTVRVNYFEIQRDLQAEKALYQRIVKHENYIVTHLVEEKGLKVQDEYLQKLQEFPQYELHKISSRLFDAILILKNAKQIHLIDSVWAAVCYHLDAKYRLFADIPITVYNLRDYQRMFERPVLLPNWQFMPLKV